MNTQNQKQSGIAPIAIILIIVGVLVVAGGIYYFVIQKFKPQKINYFTISELDSFCNLPSKCQEKASCEGKEVIVRGYIDYTNVFDKKSYPQLSYEKFLLTDKLLIPNAKIQYTLEVFTTGEDNSTIFKKIYDNKINPPKLVFVNGQIEGFDMTIMGRCQRGIQLNITDEKEINF